MKKAISLLSGGLDSILATKLILNQDIDIEAVNFSTPFSDTTIQAKKSADKLNIKLKIFNIDEEYFAIVKNPKYGYGSNINPCLDCHIYMIKKAGDYMKKAAASFLITGEVLGERPMSQRKDALRIIDRESGLDSLILRPLSAKLLEPTIPEREGMVDRSKLLSINGRSRRVQLQLAKELNITEYMTPAGGCLLTDPEFANRMRDLIQHKIDFALNDILLLKVGRHFRLTPEAKLIVGRNEEENNRLLNLAKEKDLCFYPTKTKGPVGIGRGEFSKDILPIASSIVARYSDSDGSQQLEIAYKQIPSSISTSIMVSPTKQEKLDNIRI